MIPPAAREHVVSDDRISSPHETRGHRRAHDSEPDHADGGFGRQISHLRLQIAHCELLIDLLLLIGDCLIVD
jgi:hypothetical protein